MFGYFVQVNTSSVMLKEHSGSRLREGADLSPLLSRCVFLVELDAQHEGVEAEEYDEGHLQHKAQSLSHFYRVTHLLGNKFPLTWILDVPPSSLAGR